MAPPPATFREMIPVGYTSLNEFEVMVEVMNMGNGRYRGNKYHLLVRPGTPRESQEATDRYGRR